MNTAATVCERVYFKDRCGARVAREINKAALSLWAKYQISPLRITHTHADTFLSLLCSQVQKNSVVKLCHHPVAKFYINFTMTAIHKKKPKNPKQTKEKTLVCLNSALNPLVYVHVNEDIPAHLRQLLQQVHEILNSF